MSLQDRADRAARYAKNQEEVQAAKQAALQAMQAEQEAKKEALARERRYEERPVQSGHMHSFYFYSAQQESC